MSTGDRLFKDITYADAGANLTDPVYKGIYKGVKIHEEDLDCVLKRSWDHNFDKILITGTSLELSKEALEIANTDYRLNCTVGCEPLKCNEFDSYGEEYYYDELLGLAKANKEKVTAIGVMGLNFLPDRIHECSKSMQLKCFDLQIAIAQDLSLPVYLYCRNAYKDMRKMLKKYFGRLRGVIHSFDGNKEEAKMYLDYGFYIGLSGCSLKTAEQIEVIKYIPPSRMVIESNSPLYKIGKTHAGYRYVDNVMSSVPRKKWSRTQMVRSRTEPPHVLEVLEAVSNIKNFDKEVLALITYKNMENFFFPIDTAAGNWSRLIPKNPRNVAP